MRQENKYLSIITNFGCHFKCPYCITKKGDIDIPKTTLEGLDKLEKAVKKHKCNWVSVSGGGDPLYNFPKHKDWWEKLIRVLPDGVKLELHTSYISNDFWPDPVFGQMFDRIAYHCSTFQDLHKIKRCHSGQTIRAVFVVEDWFTEDAIDVIASSVKNNPNVDELSFRQMVDGNFEPQMYCHDYLKAGHGKDWYYIEQNDYNLYYVEGEVSKRFEDFQLKGIRCPNATGKPGEKGAE